MIRLLLVRHGQTTLNDQHRYQGQIDAGLDAAGQAQAGRLADQLQAEAIDRVIASDLQRTLQTAQAIAAPHGLTVEPEPRLREMAFGDWEGLTQQEIHSRWPTELAAWFDDMLRIAPPGGESLQQVAARVQQFWDDVVRTENGQTIGIVSHGGSLRVLLCLALGLPPQDYWHFNLDMASISWLEVHDGAAILVTWNDTNHDT